MHLTLLISDLFPPEAFIPKTALPRLPYLENLLHRARIEPAPGRFLEEAVLIEFGGSPDQAVAPLTLIADGGDPGPKTWVRADPVHLRVSRDNVQLLDSHVLEPTAEEAEQIAATLNAHFARDGIRIEARDSSRWYLSVDSGDAPVAPPLWRMAGHSVFGQLPAGRGRVAWRAVQNEIQMLLHGHPVNHAREASGRPGINGVWFWGAGTLPATLSTSHDRVVAQLALARGLARHADIALTPLPETTVESMPGGKSTLVVWHGLTRALRANDPQAWLTAATELDRQWAGPLHDALCQRRLATLRFHLPGESKTLVADVRRGLDWRFWRTPKAISCYA
jgi:hypothetical protein